MLFSRVLSAAVAVGRVLAASTNDNAVLARQGDDVALNINPDSSPAEALEELQAAAEERISHIETERRPGRCSPSNTRIRKDWYVDNPLNTPPRVTRHIILSNHALGRIYPSGTKRTTSPPFSVFALSLPKVLPSGVLLAPATMISSPSMLT